ENHQQMHWLKQSFKHVGSVNMRDLFLSRPAFRFFLYRSLSCVIQLLSKTPPPWKYSPTSELSMPPNGDNERSEVSQWIGPVKISIEYHSPRVHNPSANDRTGNIWGELVHYGIVDEAFGPTKGAPWRAGANESTVIPLSHDLTIEDKQLKAGKYALFL